MPRPLRLAHELGIETGITTNGSLIDRYMSDIAECVSWTRVSIDAGSEATFKSFRPNKIKDSWSIILKSMERLSKIKRGALGYSFLIMWRRANGLFETNATEIYQAAKIAKDIGC